MKESFWFFVVVVNGNIMINSDSMIVMIKCKYIYWGVVVGMNYSKI